MFVSDEETGQYEIDKLFLDDPKVAWYTNAGSFLHYEPYIACEIIALPGKYNGKDVAYGFQKGSPYVNLFSYYLKYMEEKGISQKILEKYEPPPQFCPDKSGKPLGFDSCITGFLFIAGGLISALAMIVIEMIMSKIFGFNISKVNEKVTVQPNCNNALNLESSTTRNKSSPIKNFENLSLSPPIPPANILYEERSPGRDLLVGQPKCVQFFVADE